MGNRVRYRFSIGRGAFPASYRQGVDVEGVAGSKAGLGCLTIPIDSLQEVLGPWTLRTGNDLFFAFNQAWIHEEGDNGRFRTQDSKVSAKFQYSFRF